MKLALKAELTMHISEADRAEIERSMGEAMGAYIEKIGKLDFSTWTTEEWAGFVGAAFDVSAPQVFCRRVHVSPPYTIGDAPF